MPCCIKGPSKATLQNLAMNNVTRLRNEITTLLMQATDDDDAVIEACAGKIVRMLKQINLVRKKIPMQLEYVYLTQIVRQLPDACLVAFSMAASQEMPTLRFSTNIPKQQHAFAEKVGMQVHKMLRPHLQVTDTRAPGI